MAQSPPSLEYRPAQPGQVLEILSTESLFERFTVENLAEHRRLSFHTVLLAHQGGMHDVDFNPVEIDSGSILHLRPGQVHRWSVDGDRSTIVVFPDGPWVEPFGPAGAVEPVALNDDELGVLQRTLGFAEERLALDPDPLVVAGLRDLVIAELAAGRRPVRVGPPAYLALVDRLEQGDLTRSTAHHAATIGYSERTISRACQEAVGLTAKQVIDQRVALEARRLLADPEVTTTTVARTLGFSEPTNFVKFFRRLVAMTPSAWQAALA